MFKAFKKITAYTKMANAIDGLNIKLRELKHVLVAGSDPQNLQEEIAGLIYIVRRDIYIIHRKNMVGFLSVLSE